MDREKAAEIVRDVLAGRKERFAELIEAYKGAFYNLALRLGGETAEQAADLSQEIFIRIWLKLPYYDSSRSFFTWSYTIALNVIRNHYRQAKRQPDEVRLVEETLEEKNPRSNPVMMVQEKEGQERMAQALMMLTLEQREVLLLRYYQDIGYAEIAEILQISQSAAKMRVSRAIEALKGVSSLQEKERK